MENVYENLQYTIVQVLVIVQTKAREIFHTRQMKQSSYWDMP